MVFGPFMGGFGGGGGGINPMLVQALSGQKPPAPSRNPAFHTLPAQTGQGQAGTPPMPGPNPMTRPPMPTPGDRPSPPPVPSPGARPGVPEQNPVFASDRALFGGPGENMPEQNPVFQVLREAGEMPGQPPVPGQNPDFATERRMMEASLPPRNPQFAQSLEPGSPAGTGGSFDMAGAGAPPPMPQQRPPGLTGPAPQVMGGGPQTGPSVAPGPVPQAGPSAVPPWLQHLNWPYSM